VHVRHGTRTRSPRRCTSPTAKAASNSRGGDIVTIRPGDIVNFASGEWHWHGAAPDHAMSHLSLTEGDTEWGDHVTDTEYQSR